MENKTLSNLELYAQPYDVTARGFYFQSAEEYLAKSSKLRNTFGAPVEEFEIQFINGDTLDYQLFDAFSINQCTIGAFFNACENWNEDQKIVVIIVVGDAVCDFDLENDNPDDIDMELHEIDSFEELAQQFVDEGLFGDIHRNIAHYLDYNAIALDLGMDYSEANVNAQNYIYRCG